MGLKRGGANDIVSRLIAQKLTESLGRQVYVRDTGAKPD